MVTGFGGSHWYTPDYWYARDYFEKWFSHQFDWTALLQVTPVRELVLLDFSGISMVELCSRANHQEKAGASDWPIRLNMADSIINMAEGEKIDGYYESGAYGEIFIFDGPKNLHYKILEKRP